MNIKGIAEGIGTIAKSIDKSKAARGLSRAGKEIAHGLSKVNWGKVLVWSGAGASIYALGALSRQPEINKLKGENDKVLTENERLRYAVRRLNKSVEILHKKIEALKAVQFAEKAKETEELKGCIMYQYATKEYLEMSIKKSSNEKLTQEDNKYMMVFEKILNADFIDEDANFIARVVSLKYKDKIDNLIEYNCLPLIEKLGV